MSLHLHQDQIKLQTAANRPTYLNMTEQIQSIVQDSQIDQGIVTVVSAHTTCAVFYEEYVHDPDETGTESLQHDLNAVLDQLIPPHDSAERYRYPSEAHYEAVEQWPNSEDYLPGGDRSALWNGDAHLKSTIIGASEVFDVVDGQVAIGSTGSIYFVDYDCTRARERTCRISVIGHRSTK